MDDRSTITIAGAINTALLVITILAAISQFFIDFSTDNIASVAIVLFSSLLTILYLRFTDAIKNFPLSTLVIFSLLVTSQLGALIAQSVFVSSLIVGLRQPVYTFTMLAIFQVIAVSSHVVYRNLTVFQIGHDSFVRRILERAGLYEIPTVSSLWTMGFIGLFGTANGGGEIGNIGAKIMFGFAFMVWAPFLIIVFTNKNENTSKNKKVNYFFVGLYGLLIALIGIAVNARGVIFTGAITLGLIALIFGLRSSKITDIKQIFTVITLMGLAGLLIIPAGYLASAMVVARQFRGSGNDPVKVMNETLYALQNPYLIERTVALDKLVSKRSNYDEIYIKNAVAARFVETKFHDNSLYYASLITDNNRANLAKISIDRLLAILPDPLLKIFDSSIQKDKLAFSFGDYLVHITVGGPLGGYRTGSAFAHGIALFGYLYFIIYGMICLILYPLLDLLTFKNKYGTVSLSILAMLTIWRLFLYGITNESLVGFASYIGREFLQNILIYLITYNLIIKATPYFLGSPKASVSVSKGRF